MSIHATAGFLQVDPEREYDNPYSYAGNNPVNGTDPTGRSTITNAHGKVLQVTQNDDLGVYSFHGALFGMPILLKRGETLRWDSFIQQDTFKNEGIIVPLGQIDFKSYWARDTILGSLQQTRSFGHYLLNAGNGQPYDIKSFSPVVEDKPFFGSQFEPGLIVSARDAGNILAGMAGAKFDFGFTETVSLFGAFNATGNSYVSGLTLFIRSGGDLGHLPSYGELAISHTFQRFGYLEFFALPDSFDPENKQKKR